MDKLTGKEKLIGMVLGILLSAVSAALGLQVAEIKSGMCDEPKVEQSVPAK
ncbi:MAG: hypothetical protein H0X02_05860 [Nitrosomonas sp.]|nr:hypothetical protein [Nitrosomonas sp.]